AVVESGGRVTGITLMKGVRNWFALSGAVTLMVLLFAPLLIIAAYSLLSRGAYGGVSFPWSAESYARVFDPLYVRILWRSIWMAAAATAICALCGFPLALYITRAAPQHRPLLLNLVM